jgi:hypothetical protein
MLPQGSRLRAARKHRLFVTLADGALYRIGLSWPAPEHDETERPGRHRRGTNP